MQEAELDDCVDHPISVERRDDQMARLIASKCRAHGQVALGDVVQDDRPAVGGDAPKEPFPRCKTLGYVGVPGDAQLGGPLEIVAFALEEHARLGAEVRGQEVQDTLAELLNGFVPEHGRAQAHLSGLQPRLPLTSTGRPVDQTPHHQRQRHA